MKKYAAKLCTNAFIQERMDPQDAPTLHQHGYKVANSVASAKAEIHPLHRH
jgi:hypothetical protein